MKKIFYYEDTYIGKVGIAEEDGAITNIIFSDRDWIIEETELIKTAKKQLDEYFEGKRKNFDFPTRLEGTEFQKKVWKALESIPYGKTVTYKDIAEMIGCPKGYRAVGLANNRNPISIVYPCHRVVGSNGSLTGYGGGLDVKEKLIELESRYSTGYAFGVDIGGTEVKIGLFDEEGGLIYKTSILTRKEDNCRFVLPDTADKIKEIMAERGITNVKGIGLGVPGPVMDGIVKHCVNLHWESKVDAAGIMEKLTGIRSFVINDANAAALGESWSGGAKGYNSLVIATIGTGVGGGIVIDGKIDAGANGAGGEIGHITVEYENGRECNCGRKGCLETYASATGIVRTAEELTATKYKDSILNKHKITAKAVFDAAAKKDKAAIETIESFGCYLGRALANIAAIVDPEVIVLAGGVVRAGDVVRKAVEKNYKNNAFKTVKNTKIVLAELENDAGIYGAAKFALDNL